MDFYEALKITDNSEFVLDEVSRRLLEAATKHGAFRDEAQLNQVLRVAVAIQSLGDKNYGRTAALAEAIQYEGFSYGGVLALTTDQKLIEEESGLVDRAKAVAKAAGLLT